MVDQILTEIVPILEAELAACQQLMMLVEEQRRCLIQGDVARLNDVVSQGREVTMQLEEAEERRLFLLRRHGYDNADDVVLSTLVAQANDESLRSQCDQLRQDLWSAGLHLRAATDANMRLMAQSQQLTECLVTALAESHRPDGYSSNGASPSPNSVSVIVDSQV